MLELAVIMDSEGKVCEWTPKAEKLFGYKSQSAVGHSLGDLIVPESMRPYHEMGLKRYVTTREPQCVGHLIEIDALHQQGHAVAIQLQILPREEGTNLFFDAHIDGGF